MRRSHGGSLAIALTTASSWLRSSRRLIPKRTNPAARPKPANCTETGQAGWSVRSHWIWRSRAGNRQLDRDTAGWGHLISTGGSGPHRMVADAGVHLAGVLRADRLMASELPADPRQHMRQRDLAFCDAGDLPECLSRFFSNGRSGLPRRRLGDLYVRGPRKPRHAKPHAGA